MSIRDIDPHNELDEIVAGHVVRNLFSTVSDLNDIKGAILARDVPDLELVRDKLSRVIENLRGVHAS